jgi:hypothetical protein
MSSRERGLRVAGSVRTCEHGVLVEAALPAGAMHTATTMVTDVGEMSMTMPWRRRVLAAAVSLTAASVGLLMPGTAHAAPATTASLSFSGDSGDYISQGKSWSYSTSSGDVLNVSGSASGVHVSITGYNGDWWTLDIDAPDQPIPSQPASLAPGTYTNAHRYPFNGTGPGLDLSGDGRGCNELTGSFTITNAVFGPQNYVQTFDATFEQHCEGGTAAARGEVHIANPPAPAAVPTGAAPTGAAPTGGGPTAAAPPAGAPTSAATNAATVGPQPSSTTGPAMRDASSSSTSSNRAPLLLFWVGLVSWIVLVVVAIGAAIVVLALRRRSPSSTSTLR